MTTQYWLMKTEPESFSIDDLKRLGKTSWEGVRNYQARNFLRDSMQIGDKILIYHSNTKVPGIVGIGEICSEAYTDHFALDPNSKYYDPKATKETPIWMMRDVKFIEKWNKIVSLEHLKSSPDFADMKVVQKGSRLSIQPVSEHHYQKIVILI